MWVSGPSSRLRGHGGSSLLRRHHAPLGFGLFLVALIAVNLYVLYYKHGTSLPALMELASAGRRAALGTHAGTRLLGPPGTPPVPNRSPRRNRSIPSLPDYPRVVEVALKAGDTVPAVLRSQPSLANLSGPLLDEVQSGLRALLDPGGIGAGQSFIFFYDSDDRLAALDYRLTDSSAFHLERVATGGTERFVSSRQEQTLTRQVSSLALVVEKEGDLGAAVARAGEQPALAARLAEVFACETSAFTDTRIGDRFRLVVEKILLGGNFYRYGKLLAAEYQPAPRPAEQASAPGQASRPQRLRAFLSTGAGSSLVAAGAAPGSAMYYFGESGDSLARAICRAPLLYGKAPGGLGAGAPYRPVQQVERGRVALNYPAPANTPVVAAGAGKVTFRGVRGAGGNTVVLTHPGGIETTYQNLGRLARGLTEGQSVRLRQIIGYVAAPAQPGHDRSGHSIAAPPPGSVAKPHLHFVLRVAGKQVDPGKWRSPRESSLPAAQRAAFAEQVADLMGRLAQADTAPAAIASRTATPAERMEH